MAVSRPLLLTALGACALAACGIDVDHVPEMTFEVDEADVWKAPPSIPPPAPGEGRLYVTNNLDDTVSIVDLDSAIAGAPRVLGTVPVGFVPVEREGPHHITVDRNGEFYYVGISNFVPGSGNGPHGSHGTGTEDGHLIKMRVSDNSPVASVRIDKNPGDVRLSPDGRLLLASHFDQNRIVAAGPDGASPEIDSALAIVDPETMERLALVTACPAAHGIAVTADSSTAVMSCISDEVAIVDLVGDAHEVTRLTIVDTPGTALIPACAPYAITLDGNTAWASCYGTGEIVAVDVANKVLDGRTFQLQGIAVFGDVRDGIMVIAHQGSDGVTFIDTSVDGPPDFLATKLVDPADCIAPHYAHWSEDGSQVFLVCEGNKAAPGSLVVLDGQAPHDVLGSVSLGIFPDDLALLRRAP